MADIQRKQVAVDNHSLAVLEQHLSEVERAIADTREVLRSIGIGVKGQRVRIHANNRLLPKVLALAMAMAPHAITPAATAAHLDITREYAFDLLAALVAKHKMEKVKRGAYRAIVEE